MRIGISLPLAQALGATLLVVGFVLAHAWGEPSRRRHRVGQRATPDEDKTILSDRVSVTGARQNQALATD